MGAVKVRESSGTTCRQLGAEQREASLSHAVAGEGQPAKEPRKADLGLGTTQGEGPRQSGDSEERVIISKTKKKSSRWNWEIVQQLRALPAESLILLPKLACSEPPVTKASDPIPCPGLQGHPHPCMQTHTETYMLIRNKVGFVFFK